MFRSVRPVLTRAFWALSLVGLAASIGCNTLSPTAGVTTNSQFNTALLAPGASTVTSFTLSTSTVVGISLIAVTSNATGNPLTPTMNLALGQANGTTACVPTIVRSGVTPSFVAQIQSTLAAGTYCVSLQDTSLAEPGNATVRINTSTQTPVNVSTPTSTDVFASTVGPSGTVTHELPIAFNGTTTVTLVSAGSTSSIGMEFGAWDGSVCRFQLLQDAVSSATPIFTFTVDPGNYCIRVFDIGTLSSQILFTIDTLHP